MGVTWTNQGSLIPYRMACICFDGTRFLVAGWGNTIYTTTDGVTWTALASHPLTVASGIAYGNGIYVTVGSGGAAYSTTGSGTWTASTAFTRTPFRVSYGNNRFVMTLPTAHKTGVTTNGSSWTLSDAHVLGTNYQPADVNFTGEKWICVAPFNNTVCNSGTSSDGVNWFNVASMGATYKLGCLTTLR